MRQEQQAAERSTQAARRGSGRLNAEEQQLCEAQSELQGRLRQLEAQRADLQQTVCEQLSARSELQSESEACELASQQLRDELQQLEASREQVSLGLQKELQSLEQEARAAAKERAQLVAEVHEEKAGRISHLMHNSLRLQVLAPRVRVSVGGTGPVPEHRGQVHRLISEEVLPRYVQALVQFAPPGRDATDSTHVEAYVQQVMAEMVSSIEHRLHSVFGQNCVRD